MYEYETVSGSEHIGMIELTTRLDEYVSGSVCGDGQLDILNHIEVPRPVDSDGIDLRGEPNLGQTWCKQW